MPTSQAAKTYLPAGDFPASDVRTWIPNTSGQDGSLARVLLGAVAHGIGAAALLTANFAPAVLRTILGTIALKIEVTLRAVCRQRTLARSHTAIRDATRRCALHLTALLIVDAQSAQRLCAHRTPIDPTRSRRTTVAARILHQSRSAGASARSLGIRSDRGILRRTHATRMSRSIARSPAAVRPSTTASARVTSKADVPVGTPAASIGPLTRPVIAVASRYHERPQQQRTQRNHRCFDDSSPSHAQ